MKFSIPFLASQLQQLPSRGDYINDCVEAILFNRRDLESPHWEQSWLNIQKAASLYGPAQVTFHFPVNDSDYTQDLFVRQKLQEAFTRACDLGLQGVVVHSNRIRLIAEWSTLHLPTEREKVLETLENISRLATTNTTWLALENMPIMDNYAIEIDPLFVYPEDFQSLMNTKTKVIWDVCHFSNTQANVEKVFSGGFDRKSYPNLKKIHPLDFLQIQERIVHWHFSAFLGVADPSISQTCKEGVLPSESTLGEAYYQTVLQAIAQIARPSQHVVFEIQELDYTNRMETRRMLQWAQFHLSSPLAT